MGFPALIVGVLMGMAILPRFLKIAPAILQTTNFRGEKVQNSAGIWVCFTFILAAVFFFFQEPVIMIISFFLMGITFIGFLDDLVPEKAKGLGGHIARLKSGVITTGIIKLVYIVLQAVFLALLLGQHFWYLDALLLALGANTLNTLDTRPKRALNFYLCGLLIAVIFIETNIFLLVGLILAGILFTLIPFEQNENTILGDAGSNLLGVVFGSLFWGLSPLLKIIAILIGIVWQLIADRYSLSRLLEKKDS